MELLETYSNLRIGSKNFEFIGKGNIWIEDGFDSHTLSMAQYLIKQALEKTCVGQLEVIGYDSLLSGIFAPFSSLSSGENRLLTQISNEEDLFTYLNYIKEHIRGVQNIIQGRTSSLFSLREQGGEAIESYKLIVLYLDMGRIDAKLKWLLHLLVKVGPSAGVTFLIISTLEGISFMAQEREFQTISMFDGFMYIGKEKIVPPKINSNEIIQACREIKQQQSLGTNKVLSFSELPIMVHHSKKWATNSSDGLSFSIGKYGLNPATITLGDEINQRHNILITGAVGQGKSNLLSVIIHSLCQNYSPTELHLYLLDFKEGVTLKAFSNIGKSDYLPHAKALGLESDVEFGRSVLDHLYQEYKKRLAIFKTANVKSIQEFRKKHIEVKMPRIVVVIDEFQLMFGEDPEEGRKIADQLEKSVRLFRAAGIHFILASQTLAGSPAMVGKLDSIFGQIPIRIAHKNSFAESQVTLGMGNTAAVYLKPREAILNLDYGEVSQNQKVFIAYADEKILQPIRLKWWQHSKERCPAPIVFDGNKPIFFSDDVETLMSGKQSNFNKGCFGREISVKRKVVQSVLRTEAGHHIGIIGSAGNHVNHALGMMQAMALSLAYLGSGKDRFYICNTFETSTREYKLVLSISYILKKFQRDVIELKPEQYVEKLEELIEERKNVETHSQGRIFVFGLSMDRLKSEDWMTPPLEKIFEESADLGIHLISWWVKAKSLEKQVFGFNTQSDLINTKIFLKVNERVVKNYSGPFVNWKPTTNRALVMDELIDGDPISFIPYSPMSKEQVDNMIQILQKGV